MAFRPPMHDLLVIGGSAAGLSLAKRATLAGLSRVLVLEPGAEVAVPDVVVEFGLEVHHETDVCRIEVSTDECVVHTDELTYYARTCVLAVVERAGDDPFDVGAETRRIHQSVGPWLMAGMDVVLVGDGHRLVEMTERAVARGAFATVCLPHVGRSRLSDISLDALRHLEQSRRVVLIRGADPVSVETCEGGVQVRFASAEIPPQLFDGVIYPVRAPALATLGLDMEIVIEDGVDRCSRLYSVADAADIVSSVPAEAILTTAADIWDEIAQRHFQEVIRIPQTSVKLSAVDHAAADSWRRSAYNATIDAIDLTGDTLVVRVRPDVTDDRRRIGTVASVGVGYWETRGDGVDESVPVRTIDRLARCSRPIGIRVLDDDGYLTDPRDADEMVLRFSSDDDDEAAGAVRARLARMSAGDRMFVGPTVRIGLSAAAVKDPHQDIVMVAGDTAVAAQDAALVDLIRRGHRGRLHAIVVGPRGLDLTDPDAESLSLRYENVARTVIEAQRDDWAGAVVGVIENLVRYAGLDPSRAVIFTMGISTELASSLETGTDALGFATAPGQQSDVSVDLDELASVLNTR